MSSNDADMLHAECSCQRFTYIALAHYLICAVYYLLTAQWVAKNFNIAYVGVANRIRFYNSCNALS